MRSAGSPRASLASSRTPSTCTAPSTQTTSRTRFRRRRGSGCSLSSPEPPLRRLWSPP